MENMRGKIWGERKGGLHLPPGTEHQLSSVVSSDFREKEPKIFPPSFPLFISLFFNFLFSNYM